MMQIVFLDSTAIPKHIPIPRPNFAHDWIEYERTSAEETVERAKDADIVITRSNTVWPVGCVIKHRPNGRTVRNFVISIIRLPMCVVLHWACSVKVV